MTSPSAALCPADGVAVAERLLVRCSGPEDAAGSGPPALFRWPPLTRHQLIVQIRACRSQGRAIIVLWMRRTTKTWPGSCCTASSSGLRTESPSCAAPALRRCQRGPAPRRTAPRKHASRTVWRWGCRAARRSPPARRLVPLWRARTPGARAASAASSGGSRLLRPGMVVTSCPSGQCRDRGRRQGRWSRPCDGVIVRPAGRRPGR